MNEQQAKALVDSYTVERYANELPDKLIRAIANAPIVPEEIINKKYVAMLKDLRGYR